MIISSIVAMANDGVIGKDNDIPWYLPADLQYFKKTTMHHPIIMGRKCFESIGRPLPKRTNIIVTRDPFFLVSDCLIVHSIEEALELCHQEGAEEVFIIGGGTIYEQTQELWDQLYITEVDLKVEGDVFFPTIDYSLWQLQESTPHTPDEKNEFAYTFNRYKRK